MGSNIQHKLTSSRVEKDRRGQEKRHQQEKHYVAHGIKRAGFGEQTGRGGELMGWGGAEDVRSVRGGTLRPTLH